MTTSKSTTKFPASDLVMGASSGRWARRAPIGVGLLIAIIGLFLPFVVSDQHALSVIGQGLVMGIAATGVGMLVRQAGLVNFGAGALFGGSAYLFAMACSTLHMDLTTAAIVAIFGTTLLALIVGMLIVRSGHLAFAILTIALSEMLVQLVGTQFARPLTGGTDGTVIHATGTFFGLSARDLFSASSFWTVAWIGAAIAVLIAFAVEHSRLGRISRAIFENEERMRFSGFGTFWPKVSIFVIAGFLAGIAGTLNGLHYEFVSPDLLGVSSGGDILVAAFVGGAFSPIGPLIGAVLFAFAQDKFGAANQLDLLTGIGIIVAVVAMRRGVVGLVETIVRAVRRRLGRGKSDA
jgi:branched-chain amino acid transport system permease protein